MMTDRCSRRGAQRQQHGASQVRPGVAEGKGAPIYADERMMLGTCAPCPPHLTHLGKVGCGALTADAVDGPERPLWVRVRRFDRRVANGRNRRKAEAGGRQAGIPLSAE